MAEILLAKEHRQRHLAGVPSKVTRDPEVYRHVVRRLCDGVGHVAIAAECLEKFGPDRAPGKTSVSEFWQRLQSAMKDGGVPQLEVDRTPEQDSKRDVALHQLAGIRAQLLRLRRLAVETDHPTELKDRLPALIDETSRQLHVLGSLLGEKGA